MSVEFIGTNVLVYTRDRSAGHKYTRSVERLTRLFDEGPGALGIQVLSEFYWIMTKKLGVKSQEAEEIIAELGSWTIHRHGHSDLLRAARLARRYRIAWWDALILNSAIETGSHILWSEDLNDGQRYEGVTVRNPVLAS